MSDNARDIIDLLRGRELTPEETERIILALRRCVVYGRKPRQRAAASA